MRRSWAPPGSVRVPLEDGAGGALAPPRLREGQDVTGHPKGIAKGG